MRNIEFACNKTIEKQGLSSSQLARHELLEISCLHYFPISDKVLCLIMSLVEVNQVIVSLVVITINHLIIEKLRDVQQRAKGTSFCK